jgi:hypothetical protein
VCRVSFFNYVLYWLCNGSVGGRFFVHRSSLVEFLALRIEREVLQE